VPRAIVVARAIPAGRSALTLAGLLPGRTYRLTLTVTSPDGQGASDAATLRVRAR
jgi:hypothetical protein